MGFWGSLRRLGEDVGMGPAAAEVRRRLENREKARIYLTSNQFKEDLEQLQSGIEYVDDLLEKAEYATHFSEYLSQYTDKIEQTREALGKVHETISKPLDYYSTFEELRTFAAALRSTTQFTPGQDPVGEAKAIGAALKSLGKLAQKLPPPASAVGSIIEEMGKIFHKVVADLVPQERGTHKRVDWQVRQGGDRSIWEKP